MPVVAVNLSERILAAIRRLVDQGVYHSLESFVEVAAFNQLALERSVTPDDLIARGHREVHDSHSAQDRNDEKNQETDAPRSRRPRKKRRAKCGRRGAAPPVPFSDVDVETTLSRWALPVKGFASTHVRIAERRPPDEHLWGQVNRLFPIKLVCRWVANSAADGEWPRYEAVADGLSADAAAVGALLESWDAAAGRKRDDVLATGLPRRGNSASHDRFLSQYLARVIRGGEVQPGAVCHYALADYSDGVVVLSDQGLAFALMPNPILDGHDSASTTTLGADEADFLRRQIKEYAPGEHGDMATVLWAITGGKVTPTALAAAVREKFPCDWSEVMFRTHLSGLVARLADLRLLRRRWEGRNVLYDLGDAQQVQIFLA